MSRAILRSAHFHASEFIKAEISFMYADSLLFEENRTGIGDFDDKCDYSHRERKHDDSNSRQK
jgi:hypothetical protein